MLKQITREELWRKIQCKAPITLIDITSRDSYNRVHIPGAVHRTEQQIAFDRGMHLPDKNAEIVIYSENEQSAEVHRTARQLEVMGYANVTVYPGGEDEWLNAGLPVESFAESFSRRVRKSQKGILSA